MARLGTHPELTLDLGPLQAPAELIKALTHAGWSAQDTRTTISLKRSDIEDVSSDLELLDAFGTALVGVRVVGMLNGLTIELGRVGGTYEVRSLPEARPEDLFDVPDLELARNAWDRDADAALALPFTWQINAEVGLDRLLSLPPEVDVRISLTAASVNAVMAKMTLGELGTFVPALGVRRVYLAFDAAPEPLHLGSLTFTGLATDDSGPDTAPFTLVVPGPAEPLPGEGENRRSGGTELPLPVCLLPVDGADTIGTWQAVRTRGEALAALIVWAMVASEVVIDGSEYLLEFRGLKHVAMTLPDPSLLDASAIAAAITLRSWVFHDASPDRLLAVHQVVSLYQDTDALWHADDVLDGAEIVYAGLRSEAVAEAIRSTREAQGQIFDAVRQALKAVQDLAKSATERFLAALVAIAAVVVANANDSLSDHAGRNLMLSVAAFLTLLSLVAIFVEGPLLSLPLDNMESDLQLGTPLLTHDQRKQLVELPSVSATRRKIILLRILIPAVHLALAVLIVVFGYPSRYR